MYTYIIGEQSEPPLSVELSEFSLYSASGASPTLIVQWGKIFVIYIYMFFIYIYIYIRPYVVHVPLTRALRANVGPAG